MTTDLTTLIHDLLARLFSDPVAAQHFAQDPHGTLAAQGISDHDLSTVNVPQVVQQVAATQPLPQHTHEALNQYVSQESSHHASTSDGGHGSLDHFIQQVQQVQQIVHNDTYQNEYKSYDDHSTRVDTGDHITAGGDVFDGHFGDTTVGTGSGPVVGGHNNGPINTGDGLQNTGTIGGSANTGDGGIAAGGPVNTGAGGVAAGGPINGPINTGTGGVAAEGSSGQINTGPGASQVGGDNPGVVNTGTNTGIQAGHDVGQGTVGDGNTTVHGGGHSPINFGSGSATDVDLQGSHFGQGATIGVGGSTHGGSITQDSGNTSNVNSNNHTDSHDHTNVDSNNHVDVDSHDHTNIHQESDSHDHLFSDNDTTIHQHTESHEHVDSHDHVDI